MIQIVLPKKKKMIQIVPQYIGSMKSLLYFLYSLNLFKFPTDKFNDCALAF